MKALESMVTNRQISYNEKKRNSLCGNYSKMHDFYYFSPPPPPPPPLFEEEGEYCFALIQSCTINN